MHARESFDDGTPRIMQDEAMNEILQSSTPNEENCHGLENVVGCGHALA
jgi:hypothetical protein